MLIRDRFDPAPLLRQLELTLPDVRERCKRGQWPTPAFDNGRAVIRDWQIAEALGVPKRTVLRWRNEGVRIDRVRADHLACRIGFHPAELWNDWYAA